MKTWLAVLGMAATVCAATAMAESKPTKCHIRYSLKGWAAIYESAKGTGHITCDNGQEADVIISSKGAGVAFGKETIVDGEGAFNDVHDISELYGHYVALKTDAGTGKAADSQVMTKGHVSLALAGKGKGVELGITFGDFKIEKKAE